MGPKQIAQVTDAIPVKVFRTKATDCLIARFNNVAKSANPYARLDELEKIRDESYKLAHDVWNYNPFYNHSKKFQSAYALFHAAKTMIDAAPSKSAHVRQTICVSLYKHWNFYVNASSDHVRQHGGKIDQIKIVPGFLKSSLTITGDRRSLEALREELPVLRLGSLA